MKRLISLMLIAMLLLVGCAGNTESVTTEENNAPVEVAEEEVAEETVEPVNIKVIAPYGTPTLTLVKMMTENPVIAEGVTIEYEGIQATDVLSATLINQEADIAIVPTNLAAVLHSKDLGYKLAGSSVWGILYLVSSEDIQTVEDLRGRTISLLGRNLTPDAMLRYILTENDINPDEDVTLEYFSGASELASNYISGQGNLGMIPEPLLTNVLMKREDSKVVIDLQEEWKAITGLESYPQASVIISEKLIQEHPEVVEAFLETYDESVDWLNENPEQAGQYYEGLNIGLKTAIIQKAIPNSHLDFKPVDESKDAVTTYLNVLFDFNPKLLGGQPVDENLFFEK